MGNTRPPYCLLRNLYAGQETIVRTGHETTDCFQIGKRGCQGYIFSPAYVAFLVAQLVKNLPAMQETWVQSLGWEDPLEKGKATHSSILAWRISWIV